MCALGCFLKAVFCVLNTTLFACGLAMTVVGGILSFPPESVKVAILNSLNTTMEIAKFNQSTPLSQDDVKNIPLITEAGLAMFILGLILMFVAVLGIACMCFTCCNALMIGFTLIMIIMIILELVMFDIFFAEDSHLHESVRTDLKSKITSDFSDSGNNTFSTQMVLLHTYFNCCGIEGVADFGPKVHDSCAIENEQTGCYTKMTTFLREHKTIGVTIVSLIVVVQVVEIVLSVVIIKSNKVFPLS